MTIIAVIGSRSFNNYDLLKNTLNSNYVDIEQIVSGGANGADKLVEKYCREYNININIYYPEWNLYGKAAGPIRNEKIIRNCDEVVAFWDGISPGTKSSINFAKKFNKPCRIIYY